MWNESAQTRCFGAHSSLLCRQYLAVCARLQPLPLEGADSGAAIGVLWAVGIRSDSEAELVGLWPAEAGHAHPWRTAFREMTDRGLERVRFVVGVDASTFGEASAVGLGAVCLPSIAANIERLTHQVPLAHRQAVRSALREMVVVGGQGDVAEAFATFERSHWGSRFPKVVAEWRKVLVRLTPWFGIPERPRQTVLLGDRVTDDMQGAVSRALARPRKAVQESAIAIVEKALRHAQSSRVATG
jgi:transposase-like protein